MAAGFVRQALLFACVFAVHLFSEHEVLSAKNLERSEDFAFANFVRNFFHYLNGTKVGSHLVHAMGICAHMCVDNLLCFSYNVAAQPDINGHFVCELLASDMYNSSDQFLPHPDFHHYSIKSPCSEKPCKNGGTCIALYNEGDFKCKCRTGFKGKKCEAAENCAKRYKSGRTASGVFKIDPDDLKGFDVFCDQSKAGGGWTVFQKRLDGSVDFYRNWADYKQGFGNLSGQFWLGLDKIHRLTSQTNNTLRVELEDFEGNTSYAEYNTFAVADDADNYRLSVAGYTGTAGDSLAWHNAMAFSTKDRDNDQSDGGNCATRYKGAWWYNDCHRSNLNGLYHHGEHSSFADGVNWKTWKGEHYSAKRAEMKIRPADF